MKHKMNVVISLLGSTLDARGREDARWNVWRPSIALVMQDDLQFDQYYLIYQKHFQPLLDWIVEDIHTCSPETEVIPVEIPFDDPWNFEEVYSKLYDFSRKRNFAAQDHDFYIHITTGTHVAQICLFLLNESHHLPGRLIQTQPTRRNPAKGAYSLIDLNLACYDLLAKRFAEEQTNDVAFLKSGIATKNRQFNKLIDTI